MIPWFIATKPFTPAEGEAWDQYIDFSGLTQLEEVVSLDPLLCPALLQGTHDAYWPRMVRENFTLNCFLDLNFLKQQIAQVHPRNLLCVFRNPAEHPTAPTADFEFVGYDLVDVQFTASALTNCGGFPKAYANSELSRHGLLPGLARASEVQQSLRSLYPDEPHADCHLWAIFRAAESR